MNRQLAQLLTALRDDSLPMPSEQLAVLSDLDTPGVEQFLAAWQSLAESRRSALLAALRRLADERIELSFERVNRAALTDPSPQVRRIAISSLWECEDAGLVAPFVSALSRDADGEVRAAAAAALGSFIFLGELERIPPDVLHGAEDSLLNASAADSDPEVRLASLELLGYSSRPEVAHLIEAVHRNGDEAGVRSALRAMGRSADPGWEPAVLSGLTSPAPAVRLEAARAAGELDLRSALTGLVELSDDVDDGVRRAAIWSLGQLGGPQAQRTLQRLLRHDLSDDEGELVNQALENLAFVDGSRDFLLLDYDGSREDET